MIFLRSLVRGSKHPPSHYLLDKSLQSSGSKCAEFDFGCSSVFFMLDHSCLVSTVRLLTYLLSRGDVKKYRKSDSLRSSLSGPMSLSSAAPPCGFLRSSSTSCATTSPCRLTASSTSRWDSLCSVVQISILHPVKILRAVLPLCVQPSVRKGVLPSMLEEILETRIMVKQSMKSYKQDKALMRLLDARQLGLKLIANVTFGYTAANYSGRMPSVEVGEPELGALVLSVQSRRFGGVKNRRHLFSLGC